MYVFNFPMKDLILFFITFILSKELFVCVTGISFRISPASYFPIKNKQGFQIWYTKGKNKKLIYKSWEP